MHYAFCFPFSLIQLASAQKIVSTRLVKKKVFLVFSSYSFLFDFLQSFHLFCFILEGFVLINRIKATSFSSIVLLFFFVKFQSSICAWSVSSDSNDWNILVPDDLNDSIVVSLAFHVEISHWALQILRLGALHTHTYIIIVIVNIHTYHLVVNIWITCFFFFFLIVAINLLDVYMKVFFVLLFVIYAMS